MCFKENKSFFDVMRNVQISPSGIGHFEHDHRFFFSREM